jgi:hypothetical protein
MIIKSKYDGYSRDGIRLYPIDLGGDDSAPEATTRITEQGPTTERRTSSTKLPDFVTSNARDIFAGAKTIGGTPYTAYTGNRVSEFTPDMMTAMERMRNQGVAGEINQASGLASLTGQRAMQVGSGLGTYDPYEMGGFNAERAQQYMNPYMQSVVDVERRKAQEAANRQSAMLSGQAARQGAFGGSGAALQQRALTRDTAQQLADIQNRGLSSAYEQALGRFGAEEAMREKSRQFGADYALAGEKLGLEGLRTSLDSANTLRGLGTDRFGQETDIIKNLGTSGDIQRQREQALLDEQYRAFTEAQDDPAKKLALRKSLTSGLEYDTSKEETSVTDPGKKLEQVVGSAAGGLIGNYAQGGITGLLSDQQIDQRQRMSGISDLARMALQAEEMERAQVRAAQQGIMAQMTQQPQGTVADEEMARIAAIEQGIGGLDVPENLVGDEYTAAGGGIVAFSAGDAVQMPFANNEIIRRATIKQRQGLPLTLEESAAIQAVAPVATLPAGIASLQTPDGMGEKPDDRSDKRGTGFSNGILDNIYGQQEGFLRDASARELAAQKEYREDLEKEGKETGDFAAKARQKIEERMAGLEGEDKSALESSVLDFGLRLLATKGEKNMAKALAGAGLDTLTGHRQAMKELAAKRNRFEEALERVDEFEFGERKGNAKDRRAAMLSLGKTEAALSKDLGDLFGAKGKDMLQLYRDQQSRAHAEKMAEKRSTSSGLGLDRLELARLRERRLTLVGLAKRASDDGEPEKAAEYTRQLESIQNILEGVGPTGGGTVAESSTLPAGFKLD